MGQGIYTSFLEERTDQLFQVKGFSELHKLDVGKNNKKYKQEKSTVENSVSDPFHFDLDPDPFCGIMDLDPNLLLRTRPNFKIKPTESVSCNGSGTGLTK